MWSSEKNSVPKDGQGGWGGCSREIEVRGGRDGTQALAAHVFVGAWPSTEAWLTHQ